MDALMQKCYNSTNHIRKGRALLEAAPTVSQDGVSVMTSPIVSPENPQLKTCCKCGETKPRSEFYKDRSQSDGHARTCKPCRTAICKTYRDAHREQLNANNRAYYAANRDALLLRGKENYKADPDRRVSYHKAWYQANRERQAATNKAWRESNRDKHNLKEHRRRARIAGVSNSPVTTADIQSIRAAQTDSKGRLICWRCGKPIKGVPHLDHFIPLDKDGAHTPGNLHFMHAKCNLTKSNKHPHELGMLI